MHERIHFKNNLCVKEVPSKYINIFFPFKIQS